MKNLELNLEALGLESMQATEMQEIAGGNFLRDYLIGKALDYTVGAIYDALVEAHSKPAVGDPLNWKIMNR